MSGATRIQGRSEPAWRSPASWALFLSLLVSMLAVDLGTKAWAFTTVTHSPVRLIRSELVAHPGFDPIPRHDGVPLLPLGVLEAKLELNPGAVFGLGAGFRWFFIAFTFAALVAASVVFARSQASSRTLHVGLALIGAGGIGNLYDRIAFSRVRDFLHMFGERRLPFGWHWPGTFNPELFPWVFNVADALLLVGMIIVMTWMRRMRQAREA